MGCARKPLQHKARHGASLDRGIRQGRRRQILLILNCFAAPAAVSRSQPPSPSPTVPAGATPRRASPRKAGNGVLWARGGLALLGGYAVAATWAAALARLLPGSLADAALAATMASFVIYTLAAIWAYAARSVARAAVGLALAAAVGAALSTLLAGSAA